MPAKVIDYKNDNGGYIPDCNGLTLLDQEWTDVNNVRIRDRSVSKITGEAQLLNLDNTPNHSIFLEGFGTAQFYYYVSSTGRTYRVQATGSEAEVTKNVGDSNVEPFTPAAQLQMSAYQGGYTLVINDGNRTPQYITSIGTGSNSTELTDLPGWDYSDAFSNVKAAVVRPFLYTLVAGNITQTNTDNVITQSAGTIRISNQSTAGGLPTWDPNLGDTADEFELAESGEIREMLALQDQLMIYTADDIYSLRFTGSTVAPVKVGKILSGRGILASGCVLEFFGKHFVVGPEDIYVFQSSVAVKSVADGRTRKYFKDNLHATHYENTYVVHNEQFDEMWICFPNLDSTGPCNVALIWNYTYNTWTRRDLPNVYPGSYGPTIVSNAFSFKDTALVLPSSTGGDLKQMDVGNTFSGTNFEAYVEKNMYDFAQEAVSLNKETPEMNFVMSGTGEVDITVTATDSPGTVVDYEANNAYSTTFDISDELHINPRTNGTFLNFRIASTNADSWSLHRIVIESEAGYGRSD